MQKYEEQRCEEGNNKVNLLYPNFVYSIKTEITRELYLKGLKYYIKFYGVSMFKELIEKPQQVIDNDLENKTRTQYQCIKIQKC